MYGRGGALIRSGGAAALLLALAFGAAPAFAKGGVDLAVTIDGRDVDGSSDVDPIRLDPNDPPLVRVVVENSGPEPVAIRIVRIEGKVLGLPFFAYDTSVGMKLAPGEIEERALRLDIAGLEGQAVGLIGSQVVILDEGRNALGTEGFVADVRGSLRSVYGVFGLAVAAFTLIGIVTVFVKLARHTLPLNRWSRALQFLTPGLGLGLTAVFTLSAMRVWHPAADTWVPLLAGGGLVFFVIGYLTPSPEGKEEEEEEEEEGEEAPTLSMAPPAAPARPAAPPPPAAPPRPAAPPPPAAPPRPAAPPPPAAPARPAAPPPPPAPAPAEPRTTAAAPAEPRTTAAAPPPAAPSEPRPTVEAPPPRETISAPPPEREPDKES